MAVAAGIEETGARRVVDGFYRLGSRLVNWYLLAEGGRATVVDAGFPGYRPQLERALEALGLDVGAVEAVVLTHAHFDHIGFAQQVREAAGARVLVHEQDAELARTTRPPKNERSILPYAWRPAALGLIAHAVRMGGLKPQRIPEAEAFADGDVLEVPGRPRAVHAPGHTNGCCAFHFAGHGVLAAGDVLCNRNSLTGRAGPQILPAAFNVSSQQALDSLERIERIEAGTVVFGHGDPWTDTPATAVAAARRAGPS